MQTKINSGDSRFPRWSPDLLFRSDTQPEQSYSGVSSTNRALDRMARELAAVSIVEAEAIKQIEGQLARRARAINRQGRTDRRR